MVDCCNSDQVQSSYSAMINSFKEIVVSVLEVLYNISQFLSEIDFRKFKGPSDWTEVVTTTLLVAHVIFLILFLCSRSIIHSIKV